MIHTVLGSIESEDLGLTLMHEHVFWDWNGTNMDSIQNYDNEDAIKTMVPYLKELRTLGCQTLVEGTPFGCGRNVKVLKECSRLSGINIITNCGAWDGGRFRGKLIPEDIKEKSIDEIAEKWSQEYFNGIEGTGIKPGFIKLGIGDEGYIAELQEKLLRAAARTSIRTGLPITCHIGEPESSKRAIEIIEEEKLPMNKFAWIHIDWVGDYDTIFQLGQKGIWVEIDAISIAKEPYDLQVTILKKLLEDGFQDRILISQDAGCYYAGEERDTNHRTYNNIFTKFIPICKENGIDEIVFKNILIENPKRFLNME